MPPTAIIIDDEETICWALTRALGAEGFSVTSAASAEAGLETIDTRPPDVVFLDVRLPGIDGLTALARIRSQCPHVPVVVMTAYGDLATAVNAMKGGAFDYLTKPFDLDQAIHLARQAILRGPDATSPASDSSAGDELIGESPAMQQVFRSIALAAAAEVPVLITGESGTGKELVARALHRHSHRAAARLVTVHAAALNPGLIESELFGHVRGAYTGAETARVGLLARADGGTMFLDEVAEIPLPVQVKLLRALESGEVLPVGANEPARCNFRLIAATNRDLDQMAAEGHFRRDLLFRLNVFRIHLTPLRQRPGDFAMLLSHFVSLFAPGSPPIPEETIRDLASRPWPGNVRQLRNATQRATLLARGGPLRPSHFPDDEVADVRSDEFQGPIARWLHAKLATSPSAGNLATDLLQLVEPHLLREVLRRTGGNRSTAAELLGLDRATVRKKLQAYGIMDASLTKNAGE